MATPLDRFIQQVIESSLMSADGIQSVLAGVHADQRAQDVEQLAVLLIKQNKLTRFQTQQICDGNWYDPNYYELTSGKPAQDPIGPSGGSLGVSRGGSWDSSSDLVRSAYRGRRTPSLSDCYLGFRVVRVPFSNK